MNLWWRSTQLYDVPQIIPLVSGSTEFTPTSTHSNTQDFDNVQLNKRTKFNIRGIEKVHVVPSS